MAVIGLVLIASVTRRRLDHILDFLSHIRQWYQHITAIYAVLNCLRMCRRVEMATEHLTISINIHSTCISFSIVISVSLIRVVIVGAVITAVTNVIPIIVILLWVVNECTVVLQEGGEVQNHY